MLSMFLPKFNKRAPLGDKEKRILKKYPEPLKEEPMSLGEIRASVPKEYFDFDMYTSWSYIISDLLKIAFVSGVAYVLLNYVLPAANESFAIACLRLATILGAAFCNGTIMFGIWVIAHECGHQAYFGTMKWLNNSVGLVLHSALLVPFHSWRITHGTHHKYTNNMQRDTAFPPMLQNILTPQMYEDIPILQLLPAVMYVTLGFPLYLLNNYAGKWYPDHIASHFNPWAPMYRDSERMDIVVSVIGFITALSGLGVWVQNFGFLHMMQWYGLAYLMCNVWLVTITLLQHHSPECPHYDDEEFTFVKGALSTIDREYGWILDETMHNITNHHVAHHIFSTMPFYHAKKATPYIAKALGKHYHHDGRPLWTQFWEAVAVREHSHVLWHRYPEGRELAHLKMIPK